MSLSLIDPILEKVRRQTIRSRKRLQEFFLDFDRHNHKVVTGAQAARSLDQAGIRLTQAELDAVVNEFTQSDGFFNYRNFCDTVDEVFTHKGLETRPSFEPTSPMRTSALRGAFARTGLAKADGEGKRADGRARVDASRVLARCAHAVRTRGLVIKDCFADFDPQRTGFVTPAQFRRGLERAFGPEGMRDDELQAVVDHFTVENPDGDMRPDCDYRALHRDLEDGTFLSLAGPPGIVPNSINDPPESLPTARPHPLAVQTKRLTEKQEDVLARVLRRVAQRRVRVKEFFTDFDPLRSGFVTEAQFLRALHNAQLELTEAQMRVLSSAFAERARGQVNYREFALRVEEAFTAHNMEREPAATTATRARMVATQRLQSGAPLTPRSAEAADRVTSTLAQAVAQRRVALKDKFQDYDPLRAGVVTRARFERVLALSGLLPGPAFPHAGDVEAVMHRFAAPGRADMVHYMDFLRAIGAAEGMVNPITEARIRTDTLGPLSASVRRTMRNTGGSVVSGLGRPSSGGASPRVPDILSRVRQHALRNRIRFDEFVRDFDPLRHYHVSAAQFTSAVSSLFPFLRPADVRALVAHYPVPKVRDARGQPHVAWKAFSDDVDVVFTRKGLELDPGADLARTRTAALEDGLADAGARLSLTEERDVRDLMDALGREVRSKRILVKPAFQAFDKLSHGVVAGPQFRRILVVLGLGPLLQQHRAGERYASGTGGDGAFNLLEKAFAAPTVDRVDVNYQWFMAALDDADEVLQTLPGTDPHAARAERAALTLRGMNPKADQPMPWREGTGGERANRRAAREEVDVEAVMDRMQEAALTRGIRAAEFLADYDPLRHGRVTRAKFRTALDNAGFRLTDSEHHALAERFAADGARSDLVNYRPLVHALDGGNEHLEKSPRKTHGRRALPKPTDRTMRHAVSDDALDDVLSRLRHEVHVRRIQPKPSFEARDKTRQGLVTKAQFAAVLHTLGLLPALTDRDLVTLKQAYQSPNPINHDKVNYARFCVDVDPAQMQ